jgi:hypothetical protein
MNDRKVYLSRSAHFTFGLKEVVVLKQLPTGHFICPFRQALAERDPLLIATFWSLNSECFALTEIFPSNGVENG